MTALLVSEIIDAQFDNRTFWLSREICKCISYLFIFNITWGGHHFAKFDWPRGPCLPMKSRDCENDPRLPQPFECIFQMMIHLYMTLAVNWELKKYTGQLRMLCSGEEFLRSLTWQSSWSDDLDHLHRLPTEPLNEIWQSGSEELR